MRMLAIALALIATPAAAQDADTLADQFERALVAGDYRALPLTEDFTYIENGARLDPWDGMWRTLMALEGAEDFPELDYRVELVSGDTAVRVVEFEENTVQGVMAYRLVARKGRIASVDILPIREEFGGDRGGTLTLLQPMLPFTMDGERVGEWPFLSSPLDIAGGLLPAIEELPEHYFFDATGNNVAPFLAAERFSPDCKRYDNGHHATGVSTSLVLDPSQPSFLPYSLGCAEQVASGFYRNFELYRINSYVVSSEGLAIAFVRLDQPGTVLSFTTPEGQTIAYPGPRAPAENADSAEQFDGRILTNMITPMSVNGVYIFKFDEDGAIQRIDAFYRGAPLGWDAVPD